MNVSESEIPRIMEDWRDSGRLREMSAVREGDLLEFFFMKLPVLISLYAA